MMYSRILVPLDGSDFAEAALPIALALATRWGATLDLVTVGSAGADGDVDEPQRAPEATQPGGSYLADLLGRIRTAGYQGEVDITLLPTGGVASRLVERLAESKADFVVMTTHGRGAVHRAWLGSGADEFLRRTPVPVLLLRPAADQERFGTGRSSPDLSQLPHPFQRIVLPLDGSPEAERLLEIAAPLAAGRDAEILLLRTVPPFIPGGSPYLPHVVRGMEEQTLATEAAQDYLDALAAKVPIGKVTTSVTAIGQPALAILRFADDEGADLIALSTAGRGGVVRLLLGSVADKVIRGARVPVLVYRHATES